MASEEGHSLSCRAIHFGRHNTIAANWGRGPGQGLIVTDQHFMAQAMCGHPRSRTVMPNLVNT